MSIFDYIFFTFLLVLKGELRLALLLSF